MSQRWMLAIETSNPAAADEPGCLVGVALAPSDRPDDAVIQPLRQRSRHDDALMPAIRDICNEHGARPENLERIAVSTGPGGYTSIRIAVTTAKMIAEITGAACVPVPTALALRAALDDADAARPTTVFLAWKRHDVWRCDWTDRARTRVDRIDRIEIDDDTIVIADARFRTLLLDRDLIGEDRLRPARFHPAHVLKAATDLPPVDPADLLPTYPREPEAVTQWNQRKANA